MTLYPAKAAFRKIDTTPVLFENGVLKIPAQALTDLAFEAFKSVSFHLRPDHLRQIRAVFDAPDAAPNERFAALEFLKNACIASAGVLPLCQDTGTALIFGEKGNTVLTDGTDAQALSDGVKKAYATLNLRLSQNVATDTFTEKNSGTNLPAQIDLAADKGDEYRFLMIAKGGGSANKTFLFQETRALLNKPALLAFLREKINALGVAACPPYHLSIVIGGLSAEHTLKTVKLASAKALDAMPATEYGMRDTALEAEVLQLANQSGLGAQFGGNHFCFDVRVIRLPRHGASLPIGIGVSCIADRNILAKITPDGAFIERLEDDPVRFLPDVKAEKLPDTGVEIDLDRPIRDSLADLSRLKTGDRVSLTGTLIVARDIAHARFKALLDAGKELPDYLKRHPVYYAGPAKTPDGLPCGSFGPTTAARMDSYVDLFQSHGASMIMLAKGNRSAVVREACKKHGGFYLGTLGGAAALVASYIKSCKCVDFADLGMEAVYEITVEKLPAFILIDDKGNDFYAGLKK